jgi:hypothetical protein
MQRTTFYLYLTIILVFIVGYFYIQLLSSPANSCIGEFTWMCDIEAQVMCEGAEYDANKIGAFCDGSTCTSTYEIWCDVRENGLFEYEDYVVCFSPGDTGCGGEH